MVIPAILSPVKHFGAKKRKKPESLGCQPSADVTPI
jgi:hypothetical protein